MYLFVLCIDKLSHLISHAVSKGGWKELHAGMRGHFVSYLMFTDDLLLFGEATGIKMNVIITVLEKFFKMSRHKVNIENTCILFLKECK